MAEKQAEYETKVETPNGVPEGWQDAFKLKTPLLQKDVVTFERAYFKLPLPALAAAARQTNMSAQNKLMAAIEAGWITSPDNEVGAFGEMKKYFYNGVNVEEMHPGVVRWLGFQIDQLYTEAVEPPPN